MILVTGATGLLGSNLLVELTKSEVLKIRAMYRSEEKKQQVLRLFQILLPTDFEQRFAKIEWVKADILDVLGLDEVFQGVTKVYHCAALVSFRRRDFHHLLKINRRGTANVVQCCLDHGVEKVLHISSTSAVGKTKSDRGYEVVESNKWVQNPSTSGYANSKYAAEKEVWRGIEEGLNAVIINPSVMFGPGNWDESSMTIFRTIQNGLIFYTNGSNAFVDVRDVVELCIRLMNSNISSERFLVTGTNTSFKNALGLIAKALGKKPPRFLAYRWMGELTWRLLAIFELFGKKPTLTKESVESANSSVYYDSSKIKSRFDFTFRTLEDTISYAAKNRVIAK